MKKLKSFFTLAGLLLLAGCFEINEDIDVKADGKGVYSIHNDMSQILQAMSSYLGKDEMEKQMPTRNIDTTVMMKSLSGYCQKHFCRKQGADQGRNRTPVC